MKAYTDVEQSKILDKILPKSSYDMYLTILDDGKTNTHLGKTVFIDENLYSYRCGFVIPCWSLAALMTLLPKHIIVVTPISGNKNYVCINIKTKEKTFSDNPVDCCVKMIIKNYEQNKERLQEK